MSDVPKPNQVAVAARAYPTILRRIWDGREGADANLVRMFVRTLRAKLGDDAENPTWIFNRRGVGYRMPRPGEG